MSEATLPQRARVERERVRTVRLRIPARAEYVVLARLALSGLCDIAFLSDAAVADLKRVLTETVSGSVRQARAGEARFVSVTYELTPHALAIEVVDDGDGLDPVRSQPGARGSRLRFVKRLQPA